MNYEEDDEDGVVISRHVTRTPSGRSLSGSGSDKSGSVSPRRERREARKTVNLATDRSKASTTTTKGRQHLSVNFGNSNNNNSSSGVRVLALGGGGDSGAMSPSTPINTPPIITKTDTDGVEIANSYESDSNNSNSGVRDNDVINDITDDVTSDYSTSGEDEEEEEGEAADGAAGAGGAATAGGGADENPELMEFDLEADEDEENIVFNVTTTRNTFIEGVVDKKGARRETLFRGTLLKGIVYIAKGRPSSFNHTKRCWCILDREKFQLRCYDMGMRASFEIDLRLSEMPQIDDEVKRGDATFYPFVITSPYTGKVFTLEFDGKELRDRWLDSVAHVIEYMDPPDETLLRLFIDSDTDGSYTLGLNEIRKLLRERQIQMHPAAVEEKFREVDIDGSDEMNYSEFEAFESLIQFDEQAAKVFHENTSGHFLSESKDTDPANANNNSNNNNNNNGNNNNNNNNNNSSSSVANDDDECFMQLGDFTNFLHKVQGEAYSEDEVIALLDAFRPKTRCPPSSFDVYGFTNFLVNPISNPALVVQPRTEAYYSHPLSHYFICSAANPALAQDPMAALTLAIESNCRYFELSVIEKDGAPVFGLKNSTPLDVRKTLLAINTLFKRDSGLPVILYLCVACDIPIQFDFLTILFDIFGERISVMQTNDFLYSPAYLGGKLLIVMKVHNVALITKKPVVKTDDFDDFDDEENNNNNGNDGDGDDAQSVDFVAKTAATSIDKSLTFGALLLDSNDQKKKSKKKGKSKSKKGDNADSGSGDKEKGNGDDDNSKGTDKKNDKKKKGKDKKKDGEDGSTDQQQQQQTSPQPGGSSELLKLKGQPQGSVLKSSLTQSSLRTKQKKLDIPVQSFDYEPPTEPGLQYAVQPETTIAFLTPSGSGLMGSSGSGGSFVGNAMGLAMGLNNNNSNSNSSSSAGDLMGSSGSSSEAGEAARREHRKRTSVAGSFSIGKGRKHKGGSNGGGGEDEGIDMGLSKEDEDDPTTNTSPFDLIAPLHKCVAFRVATFAGVVRGLGNGNGGTEALFMLNSRDPANCILHVKARTTEYFNVYKNMRLFREYLLTHLARTFHFRSLKPLQRMVTGSQITPTNFAASAKAGITPFLMSYRGFMQVQGMILKPEWMLKSRPIPPVENAIHLHVKIINARQLPIIPRTDIVSPFCTAEICGFDAESSPSFNKYMTYDGDTRVPKVFNFASQAPPNAPQSTPVVSINGWDPAWNKSFRFVLFAPELDVLLITIRHKNALGGTPLICYAAVPCKLLKKGYRALTLYNREGKELPSSHLLCYFKFVHVLRLPKQQQEQQEQQQQQQPPPPSMSKKDEEEKTKKKKKKDKDKNKKKKTAEDDNNEDEKKKKKKDKEAANKDKTKDKKKK